MPAVKQNRGGLRSAGVEAQDLRALALERMAEFGWSRYRLVAALAGRVPANTVYAWLAGERELRSGALAEVFAALQLEVKPAE